MVRADFTFRALPLPAGRHQVEFSFQSDLFRRSLALSALSGALLLGVWLTSRLRLRRRPADGEKTA
jgi:hypothetical protein